MRTDADMTLRSIVSKAVGAAAIGALLGPSGASADSVALTWTAPGDDGSVGRASSYEMRYSENPVAGDSASWWTSASPVGTMPAPSPAGARESFIVTGLPSGKIYYFMIRTSDEVPNVSGYSNVAVKQTSGTGTGPLATPENFAGSLVSGGVLLTWNGIAGGGAELGYRLYRAGGGGGVVRALLATLPLSITSWTDSISAGGETYDYSLATYGDSAEGTPAIVHVAVPSDRLLSRSPRVHSYPNPARDQVTIRLSVDATSSTIPTRITIFDLTGHKICVLADRVFSPGEYAIPWNCSSDGKGRVAPGLYNVIADGPSGRSVARLAIIP